MAEYIRAYCKAIRLLQPESNSGTLVRHLGETLCKPMGFLAGRRHCFLHYLFRDRRLPTRELRIVNDIVKLHFFLFEQTSIPEAIFGWHDLRYRSIPLPKAICSKNKKRWHPAKMERMAASGAGSKVVVNSSAPKGANCLLRWSHKHLSSSVSDYVPMPWCKHAEATKRRDKTMSKNLPCKKKTYKQR